MGPTKAWATRVRRYVRLVGGILLAATLSALVPWLLGLWFERRSDGQWGRDDWGAVVISAWLSFLFFGLALFVSRKGQRRALAVANAELITSMGSLAMSSARSFAGHDHQALRIAADARAALQHYPNASPAEQSALITTVEDSYSDLAFGTFSRADSLPRSVWDQLCEGAAAVQREADALAKSLHWWRLSQKQELAGMAANIRFVLRIGQEIREAGHLRGDIVLTDVWRKGPRRLQEQTGEPLLGGIRADGASDVVAGGGPEVERSAGPTDPEILTPDEQLQRLQCLYRRELTVVKQWDVLHKAVRRQQQPGDDTASGPAVTCSVRLINDVGTAEGWCAPWYVKLNASTGRYEAVNVQRRSLDEAARKDDLMPYEPLPVYPKPLRHGHLPPGLRTRRISNLRALLKREGPLTVCVLLYEMRAGSEVRRVVLDGNHRLAAALENRRAAEEAREEGRDADVPPPARLLAFVITERWPVDDPAENKEQFENWKPWLGFTPDIGLIRGTWTVDDHVHVDPTPGRWIRFRTAARRSLAEGIRARRS
jgi:hypothetical protein